MMLDAKILNKILTAFPRIVKEVWSDENREKYDEFVECFDDTTILIGEMVDIATEVLFDIYNAATGVELRESGERKLLNPEQQHLYEAFKEKMLKIEITN